MKLKISFIILTFTLIFGACSSDKKEDVETISLEELIGDSEESALVENEDTLNAEVVDSLKLTDLSLLINELSSTYDTLELTDGHPMDRYGYNSSTKVKFVSQTDVPYGKSNMVTPKAEFYIYNFSDSIKLNNAFYNWLDCFGSDCDEVKLNEDIEAVKTPPSFTLVYDTTLIDVKYLCEHDKNDWDSFQKSILKTYGKNYRYRIDVKCGGPLKWK